MPRNCPNRWVDSPVVGSKSSTMEKPACMSITAPASSVTWNTSEKAQPATRPTAISRMPIATNPKRESGMCTPVRDRVGKMQMVRAAASRTRIRAGTDTLPRMGKSDTMEAMRTRASVPSSNSPVVSVVSSWIIPGGIMDARS